MSGLNMMRFFLDNITVSTRKGYIYIEGIDEGSIKHDIKYIMSNSIVGENIIEVVGYKIIKIPEFFALEFRLLLEIILNNRRSMCNVKVVRSIINELESKTWLKDTKKQFPSKMDFRLMDDFKVKLFDFQVKFLEKYDQTTQQYHLNGMLLAGAAGSGKTLTSLVTMHCLGCKHILIISPKNAIYKVWQDNIDRFYKTKQTTWIADEGKPYKGQRFLIVHYEAMDRFMGILSMVDKEQRAGYGIILDESHNLNELKTKRTQHFLEICATLKCRNIIFASGTPIKALAIETMTMFSALDPFFTKDVQENFRKFYGKDLDIVKDIMQRRLNEVVYKIEKSQLGLDKPIINNVKIKVSDGDKYTLDSIAIDIKNYHKEKTSEYKRNMDFYIKKFNDTVDMAEDKIIKSNKKQEANIKKDFNKYRVKVDKIIKAHNSGNLMSCKEEMVECNKFEKETIIPNLPDKETKEDFKQVKSIVKYFRLKIQGDILGKVVLRARVEASKAIARTIDYKRVLSTTDKKTVVFTPYIEVVEESMTMLKKLKYKPVGVYGKEVSNLKTIVTEFETKIDINPLVATYAALSTAVPLVVADTMIIIGVPFRSYTLDQAISRIHRLGADTQACINIYEIDTGELPNITTRTIDILKWSQEQVEKIVGMEIPYKLEEPSDEGYANESAFTVTRSLLAELALPTTDILLQTYKEAMSKIKASMAIKDWK